MNKSGILNAIEALVGGSPQTFAIQRSRVGAHSIYFNFALRFRHHEVKRRHTNLHKEHFPCYFLLGVCAVGVLGLVQKKKFMEGNGRKQYQANPIFRRFPVRCSDREETNVNGSSEKDIKQVLELFNSWSESQLEKSENSQTLPVTKGEVLQRVLHDETQQESSDKIPRIHVVHDTHKAPTCSPGASLPDPHVDELLTDFDIEEFLEREKAYLETLSFENLEMYTIGLIRELVLHRKYSGVKRELLCHKIKEEAYTEAYDDAVQTLAAEKLIYEKEIRRVFEKFAVRREEDTQEIKELTEAVCGLGEELIDGVEAAAVAHEKVQDGIEHLHEEIERCLEAVNQVSFNSKCLNILSEISYALENKQPIGHLITELQKVYNEEDSLGSCALQNIPQSTIERAFDCPLESMDKIKDQLLQKLDRCTQMAFIPKSSGIIGFLLSKFFHMMYVQQTVYPSTAKEEEAAEISHAWGGDRCNSYSTLTRNLRILGLAKYYAEQGDLYSALKCVRTLQGLPLLECRTEILRIEDSLLLNQCLEAVRADIFCRLIGTF